MKEKARIVVVGSLVFDFVARAERLPKPGETILGTRFGMFPGGKGANQAVQAGRLGAEVYLIGRVGADFLGERLLASLHESGVRTEFITRDPTVNTAACCIHVDRHGHNAIIIVPEANAACSAADVAAAQDVIRSADVLLCQLEIAMPAVTAAVNEAARHGIPVILNPAPALPVPEGLLTRVAILTPNETEAEFYTGLPAPIAGSAEPPARAWAAQAARRLLESGCQTVLLTLGEKGAYLATPERECLFGAFRVAAVDGTAAGDAFNGALAVALADGQPIDEAIAFANAAGALATTRAGAQPSLAWRAEVEALLHQRRD